MQEAITKDVYTSIVLFTTSIKNEQRNCNQNDNEKSFANQCVTTIATRQERRISGMINLPSNELNCFPDAFYLYHGVMK